ncbi:MAG: hypothetical protein JST75_05680 [Bacteroidetes bacterium]|nr:hypothetical protein [Bacteroidota bacterium]
MRALLLFFFCTSIIFCRAQDADHQDYRRKTENWSRIYDKDIRGDLASFTIGGIEESLNKTPLKKMPLTSYDKDYIQFSENNITITVRTGTFAQLKHKLTYEGKFLVKIDGKPYYGNYGKIPQTTITEVTVITGKDTIHVPQNALFDLYNPVLNSADAVYVSADKRKLYVYMLNKDEAGSYEVTWVIQDNKYLRRVLDFGFSKP